MPLPPEDLRDRFRATLLGCAIGDALGFPLEGAPPEAIARIPVLAEDFVARPRGRYQKGQYTDDTQMTLALAEALVAAEGRADGRIIASRFALLWSKGTILGAGAACTEAVEHLLQGVPWMSAGASIGRAGNGAAMRASPLGLLHHDDLTRIPRDAEVQGVITHKDPRAQAGGAAIAAGVALCLTDEPLGTEPFCQRVAQVASALEPELASEIERLPQLLRFEPAAATRVIARAGLGPLRRSDWPGISPFVVPSVLMALYAFLRHREDFRACMSVCMRAGGDVDSVSAMAGALSGAHLGCMGLPARLRRGVLNGAGIVLVADRLYSIKAAQMDRVYAYAAAPARRTR
jgi:ADP-ribosylglycohydrolase